MCADGGDVDDVIVILFSPNRHRRLADMLNATAGVPIDLEAAWNKVESRVSQKCNEGDEWPFTPIRRK